ncbi:hypothetical protein EG68_00959 [Paragonimus skrjabini miyazakii]|uniref:Uncharacterized protein n=1 Tax=Paragonimus skrjabini miyazakii TaxID=59628 RepID=A0A8S9Z4H9_9TREM|nr:hypothetical protein EG68_00959 [Paragonimus skrjabini miyazakii]
MPIVERYGPLPDCTPCRRPKQVKINSLLTLMNITEPVNLVENENMYYDLRITGVVYKNGTKIPWNRRYNEETDEMHQRLSGALCYSVLMALMPNSTLAIAWTGCQLVNTEKGSVIGTLHVYLEKDSLNEQHVHVGSVGFFKSIKELIKSYAQSPSQDLCYFGTVNSVEADAFRTTFTTWNIITPTLAIIVAYCFK